MSQLNLFSILDEDKTFSAICDKLGVENNTPAWPDKFGDAMLSVISLQLLM
jgi:DNA (cytosine-5)-methyltransferase 1